ncbi:hypothetical protein RI129_008563 [Pyrocoelia pectoralis]|uniref:Rhythmically expressed gene 2 protein n=1 Tax=Pyrocoelia pectoralis TaxID=417401 RepID=A0AAN7ZKY5_9COLE
MMHVNRLKLVTFDVTDTLLAFRKAPGQYYADTATKHGIKCNGTELSKNFRIHFKDMAKNHPNYGLTTGLGWEMWWKELITRTFKQCHPTIDIKKLDAISHNLINDYKTFSCWKHCKGALDLLSYLKHKGYTLGIISNFDPRLDATLENAHIRHYFNFIVASYDVGVQKPNPNIFEIAMKFSNIKSLSAEDCLHVGDSYSLDYEGAKNAGWNAALVNANNENGKDYVFVSLFDLHQYIINGSGERLQLETKP